MDSIRISVVVAVYNREDTLDRCIDSLVYQTFDELEILLIDDQSEDRSMEVMQHWQSLYPEKIMILSNPDKGVANAKNLGIEHARGEYVAFVDSDDYVDYKMFARLWECVEKDNMPDIVHSPIWSVSGTRKWRRSAMTKHESVEDYLSLDSFFLPGKLIRRDMFDRFGPLPLLGIGEDVSWMFPAISHANSLAYLNAPGYYYELSPNSVSVDNTSPQLVEDILAGSERIIRESNGHYDDYAKIYAYKRIVSLSKSRPAFRERIEQYVMNHLYEIELIPNLSKRAPGLYKSIEEIKKSASLVSIPQTVYLNGFSASIAEEDIDQYRNVCADAKIVILDSNRCDLEKSPALVRQAYEQRKWDFVAKYFAIRSCYEHGGIFVNHNMVVDNPFHMLLKDPAFFGFESDDSLTDNVFGCQKANPLFQRILQTYEISSLYEDKFAPLKQRIRTILVGMENQTLVNSLIRKPEQFFCLYPVDMFVFSLPYAENQHVTHCKPEAFMDAQTVIVPIATLQALSDRHVKIQMDAEKRKTSAVTREKEEYRELAGRRSAYIKRQEQEIVKYRELANRRSKYISQLENEKELMLHSFSWRITKILRIIRAKIGSSRKEAT